MVLEILLVHWLWRSSGDYGEGFVIFRHGHAFRGGILRWIWKFCLCRWSGDHEVGAEFVEAGEEGAVLGLGREVEDQVQDPVPVLPRVPERRGAIPAPEGRRVPGEGERGEVRGGRERPEHRQERQPRGAQVRPKASLRFVDITSSLFV
jgi:hypothetical protein